MSENLYHILGINENATKDEIKKAFRTLSMKWHPDKNPGNIEAVGKFQKISEAYETLGDTEKREEYDMSRNNPFMRMGQGSMDIPVDDLFNVIFGGMPFGGMPFGGMQGMQGMPRGMPSFQGMSGGPRVHVFNGMPGGVPINFSQGLQKPTPIIKTISITMAQVLTGSTIPIDVERWLIENENKVFESETVYVTIPKGVDDNEMIILRDKGNVLNENLKGDLKIFVKVENETMFKRNGLDLVLEKNISLKDSLCGFSFEIKYINGKSYTLNNNSGNIIPPEYKKIIPNMGLVRGDHVGNMVIHFHVEFPEKLTEDQMTSLKSVL